MRSRRLPVLDLCVSRTDRSPEDGVLRVHVRSRRRAHHEAGGRQERDGDRGADAVAAETQSVSRHYRKR